jgi:hypothetical protein
VLSRRRLTLHVCPADPDAPGEPVAAVLDAWRAAGFVTSSGGPGPRPLVDGGFARATVETHATPRFLSNHLGGFRVRCPVTGDNVVPAFNRAIEAWRAGGPRSLACVCGRTHPLEALAYAPEAGFARGWIALSDVGGITLADEALALARAHLGDVRVLASRG